MVPETFYTELDEGRFASSPWTTGPWDAGAQHGGPPSALLARAVERHRPRADMVVARDLVSKSNPDGRLFRSEVAPPLTRRIVLVTWEELSSRAVSTFVDEVRKVAAAWPGAAPKANG